MALVVRPLEFNDFPAWLPLWNANNFGQKNDAVTRHTWQLLNDPTSGVHGLGAFENGELRGILHYILHPTTGSIHPASYMQDMFTDPAHRGKGIAKALLKVLGQTHKQQKWARIYWVAEADNAAAQALYKHFGVKLNFTFHVMI